MDGNKHEECFATQGPEKRAQPRYSVDEDSMMMLVNHGMPVKVRIVDLSLEGCRVRTYDHFTAGKVGRPVEISFKVKGFAFRFSGVVRWSDGQHMVGIHFENVIPRRKVELIELLEEMAASVAARTQAVNQMVAEQGTQGAALPETLKAVKTEPARPKVAEISKPPVVTQAHARPVATRYYAEPPAKTEPPAKVELPTRIESPVKIEPPVKVEPLARIGPPAKIEPPAKVETPVKRPAKPRDRRGQLRHEVDTSATIHLVNVGSALRGHIVDLSLGGCRIRTDERFPVGIYTRVETEFQLQGLPFRLGGVIQAIHNRFTVGIRFLDLSERKREQVLDLIDEIEEMRAAMPPDDEPSPP
jgi:c-di-GMP-binding flagellar brake protein YcgR